MVAGLRPAHQRAATTPVHLPGPGPCGVVGGYLLLAGSQEALAPYRGTHATTIVEPLDQVLHLTEQHGGTIFDGSNEVSPVAT
ncbi:hypothetical protein ACWGI9_45200 [Streptomyces sp. NPDC054833]